MMLTILVAAQVRAAGVKVPDLSAELERELENVSIRAPEKPSQDETDDHRPASTNATVREKPHLSDARTKEIEAKIEQAQKLYDSKHYDEAIKVLLPNNDILPRSGLLLLARSYEAKQDFVDEIRTLELCLAKNSKDYVVKTVYGQALIRATRVEEGLVSLQEARELNPRYKPAYEAMVKELEKKSERYEARNVVNDMIKVFGPQAEFYTVLCRLYAIDSYHEKSVEICSEAIRKDPKVPENHVFLGLALKDREEVGRATSVLKRAVIRFPSSEAVQSAMGELYLVKKDQVRAYKHFKAATVADPGSTRAWIGYANTAFELKKNEEALNAFVKACKLDRQQTKDFRIALGRLRVNRENMWRSRFENGINQCQ